MSVEIYIDLIFKQTETFFRSRVERVMGIEPTSSAWEAEVIPLYDTRLIRRFYLIASVWSPVVVNFHLRMEKGANIFFLH
jgi:hypothetical protein